MAEVSILCGNHPHVDKAEIAAGMKVTAYVRKEESNIRTTIRDLDQLVTLERLDTNGRGRVPGDADE